MENKTLLEIVRGRPMSIKAIEDALQIHKEGHVQESVRVGLRNSLARYERMYVEYKDNGGNDGIFRNHIETVRGYIKTLNKKGIQEYISELRC